MNVRLEEQKDCLIVHNRTDKRGAITPELYEAIAQAITLSQENRFRAVILTGGAFFCAGGDLRTLATRAQLGLPERRERIEVLHGVVRQMAAAPVPLIAAVEGGAAGAGLSLMLACDFVIAAENSFFTAAYVKAGLTPDGGLTHALMQVMPRQMAMQACLLGQPITAQRLAELGAVTALCPAGKALDQALDLVQTLAHGPAQTQRRIRQLVTAAEGNSLHDQLELEARFMAEAQGSPEAAEGIAAFLEKRLPEYGK